MELRIQWLEPVPFCKAIETDVFDFKGIYVHLVRMRRKPFVTYVGSSHKRNATVKTRNLDHKTKYVQYNLYQFDVIEREYSDFYAAIDNSNLLTLKERGLWIPACTQNSGNAACTRIAEENMQRLEISAGRIEISDTHISDDDPILRAESILIKKLCSYAMGRYDTHPQHSLFGKIERTDDSKAVLLSEPPKHSTKLFPLELIAVIPDRAC